MSADDSGDLEPERHRRLDYQPQLDGVRALAVTGVMFSHAGLVHMGANGVDVFFVLSGFLITLLLVRERSQSGGVSLKGFYTRRVRRLLPALLLVCVFVLMAYGLDSEVKLREPTLWGVPAALFYLSAWIRAFSISTLGYMGHTWSLSVEEYFYLAWPFAMLFFLRRWPRHLVPAVTATAALAAVYVLFAAGVLGWSPDRIANGPDTRAHQLLFGCALAVVFERTGAELLRRIWPYLVLTPPLVVALLVVRRVPAGNALGLAAQLILVAAVSAVLVSYLYAFPRGPISAAFGLAPLVWLGRRSYGLYLVHFPIFGLLFVPLRHHLSGRPLEVAVFVIGGTLAVAAAALSYRFVERPIMHSGFRNYRPTVQP